MENYTVNDAFQMTDKQLAQVVRSGRCRHVEQFSAMHAAQSDFDEHCHRKARDGLGHFIACAAPIDVAVRAQTKEERRMNARSAVPSPYSVCAEADLTVLPTSVAIEIIRRLEMSDPDDRGAGALLRRLLREITPVEPA